MSKRTRVEKVYRNRDRAEDGTFSTHLPKDTSYLLDIYCRSMNINKTKLVNDLVKKYLEREVSNMLFINSFTKEMKEKYEDD